VDANEAAAAAAAAERAANAPPPNPVGRPRLSDAVCEDRDAAAAAAKESARRERTLAAAAKAAEKVATGEKKRKRRVWTMREMLMLLTLVAARGLSATTRHVKVNFPGEYETLDPSMLCRWRQKLEKGEGEAPPPKRGHPAVVPPEIVAKVADFIKLRVSSGLEVTPKGLHPLVTALIASEMPDLMKANGGSFQCSRSWLKKRVIREACGLVMRAATSGGSLPADYEELSRDMCQRLAILVFSHKICKELVVNADQTGMHLLPGRGRTLAKRGVKCVTIKGADDKKMVTLLPACTPAGNLLPAQLTFKGKTAASLPPPEVRADDKYDGWFFSLNPKNNWSSLETMKEWVKKVLDPYFSAVKFRMGLGAGQKSVLLLDCWSVHKSKEFRDFMAAEFPNILLIFVPARCTSKCQPVDLALNRPLKAAATAAFEKHLHDTFLAAINVGTLPADIKINVGMAALRSLIPHFCHAGFARLMRAPEIIIKGWERAGLLAAWDDDFQRAAILEAARLFPNAGASLAALEPEGREPEPWELPEMPEVRPPDGGVEDRFADLILDHFGTDDEAEESDDESVDMEALREACFAADEERRAAEAAGAAAAGAAAAPTS
jgi:hypothetical protein